MTHSEARKLFQLEENFDKEMLRMLYHARFIEVIRKKSSAITLDEVRNLEKNAQELNIAYCTLWPGELLGSDMLLLEFRDKKLESPDVSKSRKSINNFETHILNLKSQNKYGLALSLLEIGINHSLKENSEIAMSNLSKSVNTLGRILIKLGLVDQGITYMNFKRDNYEKAKSYKKIGEYKLAAHHFALELRNEASSYPVEDICQQISICYFLMNDYANSIRIIEEVLPKVQIKKNIFEDSCKWKTFATSIMVSMYKLDVLKGKTFDGIKVRVRYPLCYKYLQNCYGSLDKAWNVLEKFEDDQNSYDEFLKNAGCEPFIQEKVNLTYTLEELEENYYDLFELPMKKSLIYNPK